MTLVSAKSILCKECHSPLQVSPTQYTKDNKTSTTLVLTCPQGHAVEELADIEQIETPIPDISTMNKQMLEKVKDWYNEQEIKDIFGIVPGLSKEALFKILWMSS